MPKKENDVSNQLRLELQHMIIAVQNLTETVKFFLHPWKQLRSNFVAGIARGVGFFIGGTVVVGIGIWLTSKILMQIPVLGAFFQTMGDFFSQNNLKVLQTGNFIDSFNHFFEIFKANLLQR